MLIPNTRGIDARRWGGPWGHPCFRFGNIGLGKKVFHK